MAVEYGFFWQNVELQNGATVDLNASSVHGLLDDENSWPQPGRLAIDGFTYCDFYAGPSDARSRLRWIGLASLGGTRDPIGTTAARGRVRLRSSTAI